MIQIKIPFYPNLKDNLHCFQASLKMVLSVLTPSTKYSYKLLDRITEYRADMVTWDTRTMLWLVQKSFSVKKISIFDYHAFSKLGKAYLKDFWRPDVYKTQESQSNLRKEQLLVRRLIKTEKVELVAKHPTLFMLERHLAFGWLAILHVDVALFDKTKNYSPHSIVVTKINSTNVFFHDPGLPPEINRRVSRKKFSQVIKYGELMLIKAPNLS